MKKAWKADIDTPWPAMYLLRVHRNETLHYTSHIYSWLGDPPSFSAHFTLSEKKALSTYAEGFHKPKLEHQLGKN